MVKKNIKADLTENQKAAEEFSKYASQAQKEYMEKNEKEREELAKDPAAFIKKKQEEVFAEVARYNEEMSKVAKEETPFSRESIEISQAEFYENMGHTELAKIANTAEEVGVPTYAPVDDDLARKGALGTKSSNVKVEVSEKQVENEKKNNDQPESEKAAATKK